jgi:hypothetical protein
MGPNTFNSPKLDIEESMKHLLMIIVFIQFDKWTYMPFIHVFHIFLANACVFSHVFHIFLASACVFSSSVVDF